ncbi:response regulator transcription factor [Methylobacterium oryzae]|uniref:response regulator transcription factor n=1 Tax=Methylobacterium oryzae TaxID=334852 RepID=UPI001F3B32A5|nr:response regulator transcription factor [Methylobacterium oryzae]UIN35071.1 response regulator transcription factor [Methylobacterium oryzae]
MRDWMCSPPSMRSGDGQLPSGVPNHLLDNQPRIEESHTKIELLIVKYALPSSAEIASALAEYGFQVDEAPSGTPGLRMAIEGKFDVIILDRILPGIDGLSLVTKLRAAKVSTPVLILSALSTVNDRVDGLRAGADDYLAKPLEFTELTARVDALARRKMAAAALNELQVGDLRLDLIERVLYCAGRPIELLPKEFAIIEFLMQNAGVLVNRHTIFESVWGYSFNHQSSVIDVHIGKIRKKLNPNGLNPRIHTVCNMGFILR